MPDGIIEGIPGLKEGRFTPEEDAVGRRQGRVNGHAIFGQAELLGLLWTR